MKSMLLQFCGILSVLARITYSQTVDVALRKPITGDLTCGFDESNEEYYTHTDVPKVPQDRVSRQCNKTAVPANNMNDAYGNTFWQSTSRKKWIDTGDYGTTRNQSDVTITLDLTHVYLVQQINIRLGDAKRPGRLGIYKSQNGVFFLPWIFRVTKESECASFYNIPPKDVPNQLDSIVCQTYGGRPAANFESISFDITSVTGNLVSWREAQFIQIKFFAIDLTLGLMADNFHHYTVSSLEVMADCECNGQQLSCDVSADSGQYECTCGGNTQGRYCEQCQPFYNQERFQPNQPCEACNCFGHAESCHYDPIIANFSLSLNAQGERRGGGVCVNCQDNTTGVNCDRCVEYYFRPVDVLQTSGEPCRPCQCLVAGVRRNDETGLIGDCVMNNDVMLPQGMLPGDCFCKPNVQGPACDTCKQGFFNLTDRNPLGCQECLCNEAGSTDIDVICDGDAAGQCPCKTNVIGRQCNKCNEGFYALEANNTDGCRPCECDVGGAFNNVCEVEEGECPCRRNIRDRQCLRPENAYYFPGPHFISAEFENLNAKYARAHPNYKYFGYAVADPGVPVSTYLRKPIGTDLGSAYSIVLRYSGNLVVPVTATLSVTEPGYPDPVQQDLISLDPCPSTSDWCYFVADQATFTRDLYLVTVTTDSDIVLLDQVVLLPYDFLNQQALLGTEIATQFTADCDIFRNDMKVGTETGTFCLAQMFSISAYYLNGALPCDCDPIGSYNNVSCEAYNGQCLCKPGVFTRTCNECQLEYYSLSFQGCLPCECASDDKVCDRQTGQCECPPHTMGRQCDMCELNYFNWDSTTGCESCNCSVIGSSNLQCNLTSGVCECKQGVVGDKCDTCADGHMGFGPTGCASCQCNQDGSTGSLCNPENGQCPCKENTEGMLCDLCKSGTFYNKDIHRYGCLDCVCMGITTECRSTYYHYKTVNVNIQNDTNPAFSVLQLTSDGNTLPVQPSMARIETQNMATVPVGAAAVVYWEHPESLKGNLLGIYENEIIFSVYYTSPDPDGTPSTPDLVLYGCNGAQYSFAIEQVPIAQVVTRSVMISVENVITEPGINITRGELLLALADVCQVLISASYFSRDHQSYIANIRYNVADKLGTGGRSYGVEECTCGQGYTGLSCEECAPGYRRENASSHEYLGTCVPCECNDHSGRCDPDTGVCLNCLHNTQGAECEFCMDGYYGDATLGTATDCLPCPCFTPRVANSTCNITSSRTPLCLYCNEGYSGDLCDRCDQNYFGDPQIQGSGTCSPCECNGNSDACDAATGICLNCQFNSTGDNCERCVDGFYGNATAQTCRECGCSPAGSVDNVCDYESGNCTCLPGIGTRTCDSCLENYYGYTNTSFLGCIACECNAFGSTDLQCDEQGICACDLAAGVATGQDRCDLCVPGFWGLPYQDCQECACDADGIVVGAGPCDIVSGQCECKNGVAGRQCNKCDHLFIDSPTGCTKCGRCQDSLGNDTLALEELAHGYINDTEKVLQVQSLDPLLQNLTANINTTLDNLGMSEDRLSTLTATLNNLTVGEIYYQRIVEALIAQVSDLTALTETLESNSQADLLRLQGLQNLSSDALITAETMQAMAPAIIDRMTFYNTSAYQLLELGNSIYINMNTTFDTELRRVQNEVQAGGIAVQDATQMETMVAQQSNLTMALQVLAQNAQSQLQAITTDVAQVEQTLLALAYQVGLVFINLNSTVYNRQRAVNLLEESKTLLDFTETTLVQSASDYVLADQWLTDSRTIHDGAAPGALPINTTVNLMGITGWSSAADLLASQIIQSDTTLTNYQSSVVNTEQTADSLTIAAQALQQAFQSVQAQGQDAVNAINDYQEVVQRLTESLERALQANETMAQTAAILQAVSVTALSEQAQDSVQAGQRLLDRAGLWSNLHTALEPRITAANDSLQQAIAEWSTVNGSVAQLQSAATSLDDRVQASTLTARIVSANDLADRVLDTAANVMVIDNNVAPRVAQQEEQVNQMQGMVNNASQAQTQLRNDLDNFQSTVADVQQKIDSAAALQVTTNTTRLSLVDKLAVLEAKLQLAKDKLAALEQPVNFDYDAYEDLDNPDSGQALILTEIIVEFKFTFIGWGVLFFTENYDTEEKILVQLVGGNVVFEIHNLDSVMTATSPAVLNAGEWFRVIATRYGIDGQLTVNKMLTGGVAVTAMREASSQHQLVTTNSPIFVGGLPANYSMARVYENTQFEGCLYSMQYNGDPLPIWQRALRVESEARCCARPPVLPMPPVIDAVTLKGFGFIRINHGEFSVQAQAQMSFTFRTFDTQGVLVLLDDEESMSYYGVFLDRGRVTFSIQSDNGEVASVTTSRTYNDGEWYRASALHNSNLIQVSVMKEVMDVNDTVEVQSLTTFIDLGSLINSTMTVGGQNPNTTLSRGPIVDSFAGTIQDFQLSRGDSTVPLPHPIAAYDVDSYGVDLLQAYRSVVPGLGLDKPGYATLRAMPEVINTIEFDLYTYQPTAVILFAQLRANPLQTYFYVGIFNGNLILLFDQGLGTRDPVMIRGSYLANGQRQRVKLDFSLQNSPRLIVNGERHYGAVTMSAGMFPVDNRVYLGGVPPAIALPIGKVPTDKPLIGGLGFITVNGATLDIYNGITVTRAEQSMAYLSGLPAPMDTPPVPYSTTPAPPTTPRPTCAPTPVFSVGTEGVRFGDISFGSSYMAFDMSQIATFIESGISVRVQFRAVLGEGIIIYFASANVNNPTNYFAIYMMDGFLFVSMKSTTERVTTNLQDTLNLRSINRYDTGDWWELEALRINDFMAIVVYNTRDYNNNNVPSRISSTLPVNSLLYVGGVPSRFADGPPFTSTSGVPIGARPFQGCIRSIEIVSRRMEPFNIDMRDPVESEGLSQCYEYVTSGMYMEGTNSYMRLINDEASTFTFNPGFSLTVTFSSTQRNGTLISMWQTNTQFFLLGLFNGEVRAVLSNRANVATPFVAVSSSLVNSFVVCDNNPHDITFTLLSTGITLRVDGQTEEGFPFPASGFQFSPLFFQPLYVGIKFATWNVPSVLGGETLHSCIKSVVVNDFSYNLLESTDTRAILSGCPQTPLV